MIGCLALCVRGVARGWPEFSGDRIDLWVFTFHGRQGRTVRVSGRRDRKSGFPGNETNSASTAGTPVTVTFRHCNEHVVMSWDNEGGPDRSAAQPGYSG
jgi:hypothetical protein